jgi:hypothetical protein
MSWKELLENRQVQPHRTSAREIEDLRKLIARDLADAGLEGLSADRRFATAYNAVLQISKMASACAGYRVTSGLGHHQSTLDALTVAIPECRLYADYFDTCRRKRNRIDYEHVDAATDSESQELLEKARELSRLVEAWISKAHPDLKAVATKL